MKVVKDRLNLTKNNEEILLPSCSLCKHIKNRGGILYCEIANSPIGRAMVCPRVKTIEIMELEEGEDDV